MRLPLLSRPSPELPSMADVSPEAAEIEQKLETLHRRRKQASEELEELRHRKRVGAKRRDELLDAFGHRLARDPEADDELAEFEDLDDKIEAAKRRARGFELAIAELEKARRDLRRGPGSDALAAELRPAFEEARDRVLAGLRDLSAGLRALRKLEAHWRAEGGVGRFPFHMLHQRARWILREYGERLRERWGLDENPWTWPGRY